jgi:cytochrome c oxidase accessory protein FixG
VLLGNVFLAYFVGVEALERWVSRSPFEHPVPFIVMAVTAALVYLDFAWFREQMCSLVCPYARLQSVLLDRRSLIVGYDAQRGEPRHRGKPKPPWGDCVDCGACVIACPAGIDIRDGLQLECIACTQCIDACDSVMKRLGRPPGLVRYGSQDGLEHRANGGRRVRPRLILYAVALTGLLAAMIALGEERGTADVTILRGLGAPYTLDGDLATNQIRIKIENRSGKPQSYTLSLQGAPGAKLIAPENPLPVGKGSRETTTVFVRAPRRLFRDGEHDVVFRVEDGDQFHEDLPYRLLGPLGEPLDEGAR